MKIILVLFFLTFSFFPSWLSAQPVVVPGVAVELPNPLSVTDLPSLLNAIINLIFWAGLTIAPIVFIIAGFLYVTSAGSPGRVETAKKMMLYALIGLAVLLLARGFILVVKTVLS